MPYWDIFLVIWKHPSWASSIPIRSAGEELLFMVANPEAALSMRCVNGRASLDRGSIALRGCLLLWDTESRRYDLSMAAHAS